MTVLCVMRSGGAYTQAHVYRLRSQVLEHHPDERFVCLSDVSILGVEVIPLVYEWAGWWSKMEMFRPNVLSGETFVYLDLDTTVLGPFTELIKHRSSLIMRDVYRPHGLQSSVMVLPAEVRRQVWSVFYTDAEYHMKKAGAGGDQAFLETLLDGRIERLQDVYPGLIQSYKADHVASRGVDPNTSLLIFHGQPKPWDVTL